MPLMPVSPSPIGSAIPDQAALLARGAALQNAGRASEAKAIFERMLMLDTRRFDILTLLGMAKAQLGDFAGALTTLELSLRMVPDQANAQNARGFCLFELNRTEEALACFDRAIALKFDPAWTNRAAALTAMGRFQEALDSYDRAIRIDPSDPTLYNSRVAALLWLRRDTDAMESLNRAIALKPEYAEAYYMKSQILLLRGEFTKGWDMFEWRWRMGQAQTAIRSFDVPLWLGRQDVAGRTILLYAEQGFGDTLMCCRFVPLVAALGAKIVLEVPATLHALMKTLDCPMDVVTAGSNLPGFDLQCPLMSLPKALNIQPDTIPAPVSYLRADADRQAAWANRFGPKTRPRIGLVWFGSLRGTIAWPRSMAFEDIVPITQCNADFYSLQKQMDPDASLDFQTHPTVIDLGPELHDFADTAAAISQLDLVISVDTAVVHLAGALGKPVWVLLATWPEWKWGEATQTPWYPSARIFRQTTPNDWSEPLEAVKEALVPWLLGPASRA
jgi:Flp pilus assembly protein TadD